jgi:O-methyltransferase
MDYLRKVIVLGGDICEFGVAQGATSALLAYEIKDTDKKIWLFDSFEGLPEPSEKDILIHDICGLGSMEAYKGEMSCPEDMVRARLADIGFPPDRTRIVPGFLEETIHNADLPQKVCFAYIDFALYEPTLVALQYLDKVLVQGGIIGIDDYDYFSKGVKTAVDEFYHSRKGDYEMIVPLKSAGPFCFLQKIH